MTATTQLPPPSPPVPPTANPTPDATGTRRLTRSTNGRLLGGVCAGFADRYGWDRSIVRILAVLSILFPGPQVLAYVILWLVLPDEADDGAIVSVDVDRAVADARSVVRR